MRNQIIDENQTTMDSDTQEKGFEFLNSGTSASGTKTASDELTLKDWFYVIVFLSVFLGLPAWGVWSICPDGIKYGLLYQVGRSNVHVEKQPSDCDWGHAPIGDKGCHYDKQVSTVLWATSTTGLPILSSDDGKTWSTFTPQAGVAVPRDPTVKEVYVSWEKKED